MAKDVEIITDTEESPKEKKKREKAEKKALKKGGNFDAAVTDGGTMYLDAEEDEDEGSLSMALITMFIVIIWLAILCLLIKLDVGGFGSGILAPIFKNVPVINKILPDKDVYVEEEREFKDLNAAVAEIERLRAENEELKSMQAAAEAAEKECAPITDIRATQEYRRKLVYLSIRDALTAAVSKNGGATV